MERDEFAIDLESRDEMNKKGKKYECFYLEYVTSFENKAELKFLKIRF